jgi:hypothetical protein
MSVLEEAVSHMLCVVRLEGGLAPHTSWQIPRQWQQSVAFEVKRIEMIKLFIPFVDMITDASCEVLCVAIHNGQQLVRHIFGIVFHSDGV